MVKSSIYSYICDKSEMMTTFYQNIYGLDATFTVPSFENGCSVTLVGICSLQSLSRIC
jgi:hypothetical protein